MVSKQTALTAKLNSLTTALIEAVREDAEDPSYRRKMRIAELKAMILTAAIDCLED